MHDGKSDEHAEKIDQLIATYFISRYGKCTINVWQEDTSVVRIIYCTNMEIA